MKNDAYSIILDLLYDHPNGLGYNELKKLTGLNNSVYNKKINDLESEKKITKIRMGNLKNSPVNIKLKHLDDILKNDEKDVNALFDEFYINLERLNPNQKSIYLSEFLITILNGIEYSLLLSLIRKDSFYYELFSIKIKKQLPKIYEKMREFENADGVEYLANQTESRVDTRELSKIHFDEIKNFRTNMFSKQETIINSNKTYPTLFLLKDKIFSKFVDGSDGFSYLEGSEIKKIIRVIAQGDRKYTALLKKYLYKEFELFELRGELDKYRFKKSSK